MTAQQLINGLRDIEEGRIPVDCIIDMVPEIALKLEAITRYQKAKRRKTRKAYADYLILNDLVNNG